MATGLTRIKINSCTHDDLTKLPGIGKVTADRIIEAREAVDITPEIFMSIPGIKGAELLVYAFDYEPSIAKSLSDRELNSTTEELNASKSTQLPTSQPAVVAPQVSQADFNLFGSVGEPMQAVVSDPQRSSDGIKTTQALDPSQHQAKSSWGSDAYYPIGDPRREQLGFAQWSNGMLPGYNPLPSQRLVSPIHSPRAQPQLIPRSQPHYTMANSDATLSYPIQSVVPNVTCTPTQSHPHVPQPTMAGSPNYFDVCRMVWQLMSGMPYGGVGQLPPPYGHFAPSFGGSYPPRTSAQSPLPQQFYGQSYVHQAPHPSPRGQGGMMYSPFNQPNVHRASQPFPQGQGGQMRGAQSSLDQRHLPSTQGQGDLISGNPPHMFEAPLVSSSQPMYPQPPQVSRLTPNTFVPPISSERHETSGRVPSAKPVLLPKTLSYDGKSGWAAFYAKFQLFVGRHNMTEDDKVYHLCLALEGEAGK